MATLANHVIVQVVLARTTGLPEDVVTNTFHIKKDATYAFSAVSGIFYVHIVDFYNGLTSPDTTFPVCNFINDQISRAEDACSIRWYDGSLPPNSREPVITEFTLGAVGSSNSYPAEVSCCLSFKGVGAGVPEARRRGRVYIGPLNSDAVGAESSGDPRPDATFVNRLNDAAARLYDNVSSEGSSEWVVYSPTNNAMYPIDTAWVDNAFDTQRRRGVKPTTRTQVTFT